MPDLVLDPRITGTELPDRCRPGNGDVRFLFARWIASDRSMNPAIRQCIREVERAFIDAPSGMNAAE